MPKESPKTAADFIPDRPSLTSAREAAKDCQGCDLWMRGTPTVFGEGSRKAELMLVGEQPGDAEDLSGHHHRRHRASVVHPARPTTRAGMWR
jgi:hypothetical protein